MTETIAGGSPCEEDSLCGPQLSPSCGDHGAGAWRRHGGAVDHEVTSRAATCKHSPLLTLCPGLQRTTTPGCGTPCCRRRSGYVDLCLDIYVISIVLFIIQLSYYCKHPSNALKEPRRSEEMRFHVFDFLPSAVLVVPGWWCR